MKTPGLKGKVVAITGGGGVLPANMARTLAAEGCLVVVLNRTAAKGEAVAEKIRSQGLEAYALACDVLKKDDLNRVAAEIRKRSGGIDVLINGAGGNEPSATTQREYYQLDHAGGFFDLDDDGFSSVFDTNFIGTYLPCKYLGPLLVGRPGSSVINISSMASFYPMTKVPAYAAAKAAVNNFTYWLAVHFAQAGVRVNAIAPGFFSTEQNKALLWNTDGTPTQRTQKIIEHTPMRRLGEAKDLDGTLLWLADSTQSAFVTGVVVPVDGGFLAYSGV